MLARAFASLSRATSRLPLRSSTSRALVVALVASTVLFGPARQAVAATGDPFRFIYDQNGRLRAAVTPTDSAKWAYDAVGNITAISRQVATTLSVIEFAPHAGSVGAAVRVYGTAFSTTPSSNIVKFNGVTATVSASTTTEIVTTVPSGATSGTISVTVGGSTATSSASFTVQSAIAPTITGFTPARAAAGSSVTVSGTNFDTVVTNDQTTIAGSFARVSSAVATSLSVIVPPFNTSGRISVATVNGIATSSADFFAPPPGYVVADIDPTGRLVYGQPVTATFTGSARLGLEVFDGTAGQRISLALSRTGIPGGYALTIRGPDGTNLFGPANGTPLFVDATVLPLTGTYTVIVDTTGLFSGTVTETVYDVGADPTATLTAGGPAMTDTISVPGQDARFTFVGTAGRRASLRLSRTGLPGGYFLSITNPDGTTLLGYPGTPLFIDATTLPQTGTYAVRADVGNGETGTVTAQLFDVVDATSPITPGGAAVTLTIDTPGQDALYTFSGSNGQRISLTLSRTGLPGGYYLSITNPDGSSLYGQGGTPTFVDATPLQQTGTYTIRADIGNGETGSVTAQLFDVPADATSPITPGAAAVTLTVTTPGQNAIYTFSGTNGERISLTLSRTGIPDGYILSIKNPDGSYLYGPQNGTPNFVDATALLQAGTYTILVDVAGTSTGSVTAQLFDVVDASGSLTIGGPGVTLTVTTPGQNAIYSFAGTTADALTLTLSSSLSQGHYLSVKNPDGSYLYGPQGGSPLSASFTLTQTGTHTILVDAADAGTGSVTATLARSGGLAPGGPVLASLPESGRIHTSVSPLAAADRSTTVTPSGSVGGYVYAATGEPLANVRLGIEATETTSDALGRFFLEAAPSGHQTLWVDGHQARANADYGAFEIAVDVPGQGALEMPFRIWLTRIDQAHATTLSSPTVGEVVLTSPRMKGLEVHLAPGTVITDEAGQPVRELSLTQIDQTRPPFPLPSLVETPVYFTVQPGRTYLSQPARIYYPAPAGAKPGTRAQFWHYDPDGRGWYVYGWGQVSADGRQIVPDPGVEVYELTASMVHFPNLVLAALWPLIDFFSAGDPVDLGTGLFILDKTDLAVPDVLPIALSRTYRSQDTTSRFFGIGATSSLEVFLRLVTAWQELDLVLPDGGQLKYLRTNPGNGQTDGIFEHTSTPSRFYKSRLTWNGNGWDLVLKDGTKFVFNNDSTLAAVLDRLGNKVTFTRVQVISNHIDTVRSPNGRWLKVSYDGSDRISSVEDNIGRTVGYSYDASGRLFQVTDPAGKITEYGYDTSHRLTTIKDPRLITFLTNVYDPASGRVSQQTQADTGVFQFSYTVDPGTGKVTQTDVTDPRNFVRRVLFNAAGYGTSETVALGQPEQQTTTYERDPASNLVLSVTDALSRVTRNTYDTSGNLLTTTSLYGTPDAVTITFTYEPTFNQLATVSDPLMHSTTFGYDTKGNRTSETDALQHQTTFGYTASGQLSSTTNALQKTTSFSYQNGDLISVTDPLNRITGRFSDAAGRPVFVTDPLGNRARTDYDSLNRVTQVTDPLGGVTVLTYDENGNRLTLKDARLNVTTYTYDNMDQLATRKDALLHSDTYTYDKQGNLLTVTDRKGQVTEFRYDSLGRQKFAGFGRTGTPPNFSYASTVNYTYDAGNRLTQAADSASGTVTRGYDLLDRLTSETTGQGVVGYQYDTAGRRTQFQVTGQTAVTYGYDNADRLMSITQGTTVIGFGYDSADRRTSLTLPGNLAVGYGYDDASQLLALTFTRSGSTIGDLAYSYDPAGRRATTSGSYARLNLPVAVTSATYNANNQLTKWGSKNISHDLNGNMAGDGTNTYSWDTRDQLSAVTKQGQTLPSFMYDAFGRRQKKTLGATVTSYLYDGANTVQELTGASPSANILSGLAVDELFQRTEGAISRTFLADALGSVIALADSAGVVQTSYTYAPYGETTVSGATSNNTSQYTGRENDSDGLYFYRARYVHSVFSRFLSEDPLGFGAGDSNLYRYVLDNPVNYSDPMGQIAPLVLAGLVCAAGAAAGLIGYAVLAGRKGMTFRGAVLVGAAGCGGALLGFFAGGVSLSSVALLASRAVVGLLMPIATATTLLNAQLPRLAQTPAVRNAIAALYKVSDAYPGGTAAAVVKEAVTGKPTQGVFHALSALPQRVTRLENILQNQALPAWDRALTEWMLRQLRNAQLR